MGAHGIRVLDRGGGGKVVGNCRFPIADCRIGEWDQLRFAICDLQVNLLVFSSAPGPEPGEVLGELGGGFAGEGESWVASWGWMRS